MSTKSRPPARRRQLLLSLALAALTFAVFLPALHHDFVHYDDPTVVTENPFLRSGLSRAGLRWALTTFYYGNWMPVTWLSHLADFQFFGLDPRGHHLTSLIVHSVNAAALFLVLQAITGSLWRSLFVAALFGIHPLRVESVAWVTMRRDLLSGFFWFLTMGAYAAYAARPSLSRYSLVAAAFALGLMSKSMVVTLPLVLLLLDYWPLRRLAPAGPSTPGPGPYRQASAGSLVGEKLPLLGLAAVFVLVNYFAQRELGAVVTPGEYPFHLRLGNALLSYAKYLGDTIWPRGLIVFYPHPGRALAAGDVALAGALLLALTALCFRLGRRHRYLVVGWCWFLVGLLPVIGLIQLGEQARADRFTYLPLVGVFLMAVWGVSDLVAGRRRLQVAALAAGVFLLCALAVTTRVQVGHWRDSTALFEHALAVDPANYTAHINLGNLKAMRGDERGAIAHYEKVLAIRPRDVQALVNLGISYTNEGRHQEAVAVLSRATSLEPGLGQAHFSLARAYQQSGRLQEALDSYARTIAIEPRHARAHLGLGLVAARLGRRSEALREYELLRTLDVRSASELYLAIQALGP